MQRHLAGCLIPFVLLAAGCVSADAGSTSTVIGEPVAASVTTLSASELAPLVEAGSIVLVDVRTDEEVAEGMIPGAIHMPLADFDPLALPDPDDAEIILYCRSSRRSGQAAQQYVEATGLSIRHLDGGILAWQAADLPVETPD
ncbi:rhodanese-like domain-containing protein [Qipengyuania sp. DSG2-2]|uniref:rhodanese-like domain-containing protein n=1 Tax=Qipengyuania sp. DGS2-2 TaxID=3349631 RepID=UPI0036D4362D